MLYEGHAYCIEARGIACINHPNFKWAFDNHAKRTMVIGGDTTHSKRNESAICDPIRCAPKIMVRMRKRLSYKEGSICQLSTQ